MAQQFEDFNWIEAFIVLLENEEKLFAYQYIKVLLN